MTSEASRPMPVMPMTLRASTRTPPGRLAPVTPSWSAPIAIPVSASAAPSRRYGSQRPAGPLGLAERAVRRHRDQHRRPGLDDHRALLRERSAGHQVPVQHGAERAAEQGQREQRRGHPPAAQVQPRQPGTRREPPGRRRRRGRRCRGYRRGLDLGGRHGICARVMVPERSAAMFAASQACRAADDSDSNPLAAAVIWAALASGCVPDAPDALDVLDAPDCVPGWLNCGYSRYGSADLGQQRDRHRLLRRGWAWRVLLRRPGDEPGDEALLLPLFPVRCARHGGGGPERLSAEVLLFRWSSRRPTSSPRRRAARRPWSFRRGPGLPAARRSRRRPAATRPTMAPR